MHRFAIPLTAPAMNGEPKDCSGLPVPMEPA